MTMSKASRQSWINTLENQGNQNQKHTIDSKNIQQIHKNQTEKNSGKIQKKAVKQQKEKERNKKNYKMTWKIGFKMEISTLL